MGGPGVKTAGLIGGIGPESTLEYYRQIVEAFRARRPDGHFPLMIVNSIDLKPMLDLFAADRLSEVAERLHGEIERLARAGADFGVLSANSPHIVFDELARRSSIPLLSIVEATRDAAKARGLTRLGLFGTRYTMSGRFYPEVFAREGLEIVPPEEREQAYIHEKYLGELVNGIFLDETRERLIAIARAMSERDRIDGLILGGTELPLILKGDEAGGVPLLDTTRIHVARIVDALLA